jgi:aldose 1-epimerase
MRELINLAAGDLTASVSPDLGGRVTKFARAGVDLFTSIDDTATDPSAAISGGCYPLVPWSNRIRDGYFAFEGQSVRLTPTESATASAIHGHGNRRAWTVAGVAGQSVRLTYDQVAGDEGWPFPYQAEQLIHLSDEGLSMTLACTNTGHERMPVGLGLHPYFPKHGDVGMWFQARNTWPPVDGKFPLGATGIPERIDFSDPKPAVMGLDQGFGGWDGEAHLIWPQVGLGLSITGGANLEHLIVYSPEDRDYICVEPVSHAIDAVNLVMKDVEGTGFRILEPKHRFAVTVRFAVNVFG